MVKTPVAMRRSQGTKLENVAFEVLSSRMLPISDPTRLAIDIHIKKERLEFTTVSRYTHADAKAPGKSTSDAVAFA
jgi:hypothetical protein